MPPCLSRPAICELTGFNSWTAIQAWLLDVVEPAFQALIDGYLRWHERRGEKTNHGPDGTKEHFIRNAQSFEREVARRVAEIRTGNPPRIPRPARECQPTCHHFRYCSPDLQGIFFPQRTTAGRTTRTSSSRRWRWTASPSPTPTARARSTSRTRAGPMSPRRCSPTCMS
ncbi:hypothetical protein BT67DRAFT_443937 [Trichocladium antarcticum]|uniref:Uncharacterized protein n=1 Tax=Trichocladium antarcticum TaxID=1450529 RepID=A0AAN6UGN2_9PEZI|nr:hypothetical protein BT67DRAFT_443937 [Trichocladium antarcticum]